ncbi:MAG: glycosyltransferase family 2 protein [Candidatus Microsaccharimonas sp.]
MAYQLKRILKKSTPPIYTTNFGNEVDLPSVTVCIPARNEQHALTECLEKVIASDYDRLEIIVLDDVSGDDTSALIKSFASEGVRFVKGSPLTNGWLGKNHALQGLLNEASGSYILFMDVDTRLSPKAISNMVRFTVSNRSAMLSVLPRREDGWRASVVFSPLRYFWELIFSRRLWPATASSAWLIRREILEKRFNGFDSFKDAIQPETKIASELAQTNEYRFLVGNESLGVGYEKKWSSQLTTSIRLMFPLLYMKPLLCASVIIDLLLLLVPFIVLGAAVYGFSISVPLFVATITLVVGYISLYGLYTHHAWKKGWLLGALLWPIIIIQELVLVLVSVIQYRRRTIKWKGRLIQPEARN